MRRWIFVATLVLFFGSTPLAAEEESWRVVMPDASALGPPEGAPPAMPAFRDGQLIGYVVSTKQAIDARGYAGGVLDILIGIDLDGHLIGANLMEQHEPILKTGVRPEDLEAFVDLFADLDLRDVIRVTRDAEEGGEIDAVSGATISSVVIGDVILRAARAVASSRGLLGGAASAVNFEDGELADWPALLDEGSIEQLSVAVRQASDAIGAMGAALYPPGAAPPEDAPFVEIYAGLATPARVGRSLLGDKLYNRLMNETEVGGQLLFVAASGAYSFKGTSYVRDGSFDRFRLLQGAQALTFEKDDHVSIDELMLEEAPELREIAIFRIAADDGLVPTEPWTLELLVTPIGKKDGPVASFMLPYDLPDRFLAKPAEPSGSTSALWQDVWRSRAVDIAVLTLALVVLTGILIFQNL
ncbi:MAG: FMN-binding protein, partial [Alphaproteobacteria bacterium]|nr:FMN-binding protein [Alphaproteobacteria bacterium]